jgi:hypothetical protein
MRLPGSFQRTRLDKVIEMRSYMPDSRPSHIKSRSRGEEDADGVYFTGGSLGWKVRGSLMHEFEEVAYGLEPSTTGNPKWGEVKTKEGYHILMVEGRK